MVRALFEARPRKLHGAVCSLSGSEMAGSHSVLGYGHLLCQDLIFLLFLPLTVRASELDLWRQNLDPVIGSVDDRIRHERELSSFLHRSERPKDGLTGVSSIRIVDIFAVGRIPIRACDP